LRPLLPLSSRTMKRRLCFTFVLISLLEYYVLVASFCPTAAPQQGRGKSKLCMSSSSSVRFLGKAADAIVRPGVVLVAPSYEFSTYLRESAVFVHAMGYDETLEANVIRGVVIDYPTAFTIGEMSEAVKGTLLANNVLYRGGSEGGDSVIMLHSFGGREEIGSSGIYEGGLLEAMAACDNGSANPEQFKFFFNYCQFGVKELEDMLDDEEDGDAWVSVQVAPSMVLNWDWARGECWKQLRNSVRQHIRTE
jgi:Uncharacterized ACR, COG1678